jgi:hypothetical protein
MAYRNNIGWGSVYLVDDVVDGQVDAYADLANLTDLYVGDVYLVKTTTGIIGFRKLAGLYRWDGSSWTSLQLQMQGKLVYFNNTGTELTSDNSEDAIKEINNKIGYWDS